MALTIYWSKTADKDFDRIIEYLNHEWGESVTRAFVKKTYDFLDILSEFSEIGSLENEKLNIRGFVLMRQIVVFYKIKHQKIILLKFFNNKQHPERKRI